MPVTLPTITDGDSGQAVADAIDANFQDLETRLTAEETKVAVDDLTYTPQATPPTHVEGKVYYDAPSGTLRVQGAYNGVEVSLGHMNHLHVINQTGLLIEKGSVLRHDGVSVGGKVKVVKALADTFDNARVFGVAQEDIADGAESAAVTIGEISGLNTSGFTAGVPLYLSDIVAGTLTETPPDIVSRVGGVSVSDAVNGQLIVYIINNLSLPNVFAGMQGQTTPIYSTTAVAQDINGYVTDSSIVMVNDLLNGTITLSNNGGYRMHLTADISFVSATSTRSVTFELYNQTTASVIVPFTKNIPRDATTDALSFSLPIVGTIGDIYKIRVKSSVDMDVTMDFISFDIQSVNII